MAAVTAADLIMAATLRARQRRTPRPEQASLLAFTSRMVAGYDAARHIADELVPALEWAVATPDARLIVTMPPRFSKSLHVSENLPAWYLGNHPDRRVIAASHTAALAYTFSRRVRNKMIDPRWPFPGVTVADDKGAVQSWDTNRGGGYLAVGVGGSPTGHGASLLIIDDPLRSAADADSQTIRDALWEWYQGTMRTRLEPGGSILVTSTRWHTDDLTGRLLAEMDAGGEQWRHLHLPAVDADGASLWPGRWPVQALDAIRRAVGSRAWTAQYMGAPVPASGGILKRHWFRFWQHCGMDLPPVEMDVDGRAVAHPVIDLPGFFDDTIQSWDLTFRETRTGSYVAGLTGHVSGARVFLAPDRFHARTDFPGTIAAMTAAHAAHPETSVTLVENRANGPAILDVLRPHVPGLVAVEPDGSKEARMHAAAPFVEGGGVVLPHPRIAPWVDEFLDEVTTFPLAAHDDEADALSQLVRRVAGGVRELHEPTGALAAYLAAQ